MQSFNDPFLIQQDEDLDRTVGINTGHVGTSDFTLEEEDRSFAVAVSVDFSFIKQNKTSVLCSKTKEWKPLFKWNKTNISIKIILH